MSNKDTYYATFAKTKVDLYDLDKQLIRRFNMKSDVVNAQVTGAGKNAIVAITMKNGQTWVYRSDGTLVRR